MRRLVILTSAEPGDHLPAILASQTETFNAQVVGLVASHPQSPGLAQGQAADVATETLDWSEYCRWGRPNALYEEDLAHVLQKYSPDLILLDGWSVPLSRRLVRYFPWRVLKVSKGLIDDAGAPLTLPGNVIAESLAGLSGRHAVQAALSAGVSPTGSTVHVVLDGLEYGPVVTHAIVPIERGDTADTLAARWQATEQSSLLKSLADLCRDSQSVR